MKRVLVYSNFGSVGERHPLIPQSSEAYSFSLYRPRLLRRSAYPKQKHMSLVDKVKLIASVFHCAMVSLRRDVVVADSMQTGVMLCLFLFPFRRVKVVIWGFNVPRRRTGLFKTVVSRLLQRADKIVVFGTYDIGYTSEIFSLPESKFTFVPYSRDDPVPEAATVSPWGNQRYVISVGANARDFATLFDAVRDTDVRMLVVTREYCVRGLNPPANVKLLFNIPLQECDEHIRRSEFMVMPLDGSEPSCGQVTVVTAFMFGLPVVASACTGTRDYIEDDSNGVLVEIGDVDALRSAIDRLWDSGDLRERMSISASAWAAEHASPGGRDRAIEEVLDSVLSGNAR